MLIPQTTTPAASTSGEGACAIAVSPPAASAAAPAAVRRTPSRRAIQGATTIAATKLRNGNDPMSPAISADIARSPRIEGRNSPKTKRARP